MFKVFFFDGSAGGGNPANDFLFMDGTDFLFMDGTDFLFMS